MTHESQTVVLVTGASSGIGKETASLLASNGFRVFGTSRNPDPNLRLPYPMLSLDVRSDASVHAAIQHILEQAGRIDVLINNAGYELGGAIEEITLEEAKLQFETNFFGVARVIKAVLPAMRERGSGHIINMSSVVGWLVPIPFLGYYAASKMAVEAYTEVLRHEVLPFGVKVSLIEPSFINTNLGNSRQMAAESLHAYVPWRQRAYSVIELRERTAPPPRLVAMTILQAIQQSNPRPRYTVGEGVWRFSFIRRFLPWFAYERGIRNFFKLEEQGGR